MSTLGPSKADVARERDAQRVSGVAVLRRHSDIDLECDAVLVAIGDQLEVARKTQGLTLAETAGRSGVSRRTLANMLRALRDPRLSTLVAAARGVGCRLVVTLERDDHQQPSIARRRSYDDLQAAAVRVTCVECSREYDATAPIWRLPDRCRAPLIERL